MEHAKDYESSADVINLFAEQQVDSSDFGESRRGNWMKIALTAGSLAVAATLTVALGLPRQSESEGLDGISLEVPATAAVTAPVTSVPILPPPAETANLPADAVEAPIIETQLRQVNQSLRRRIAELNQENQVLEDELALTQSRADSLEARADSLQERLNEELSYLPYRLEAALTAGVLQMVVDQPVAWRMTVERRWFGRLNDEIINLSLPGAKAVIGIEGNVDVTWNRVRTRLKATLPLPRVLYIGTMATRNDGSPILIRLDEDPGWLASLVQVMDGETSIDELEHVATTNLKQAACDNSTALGKFISSAELALTDMANPVPVDINWRDSLGNVYSSPLPAALLTDEAC